MYRYNFCGPIDERNKCGNTYFSIIVDLPTHLLNIYVITYPVDYDFM